MVGRYVVHQQATSRFGWHGLLAVRLPRERQAGTNRWFHMQTIKLIKKKSDYYFKFGGDEFVSHSRQGNSRWVSNWNKQSCLWYCACEEKAIFQPLTLTDALPHDQVCSATLASLTIYLGNESSLSKAVTCMRVCMLWWPQRQS